MQDFEHDWRDVRTYTVARAALAKIGLDLEAGTGNDVRSLVKDRATLRRGINELKARGVDAATKGDEKTANEALDETAALGEMLKRVQGLLDCATNVRESTDTADADTVLIGGRVVKALRSRESIRAHYERHHGDKVGLADFLRGVAGMNTTGEVRNALSVGTDSEGGYSVPSSVMPMILEALVPASTVLQAGAGILPLDTGAKTFTMAAVNTVPTAAWRSEGGNVAESDPAFRAVVMTPRSLAFRFKVSRELLADGVGIEQALITAIAQAFAKELDRTALRGTGTAPQPRGLLNTTDVNAVANGANGASLATTAYANFASAVQAILEDDAPMPTAAIMSPRSLVTLGGSLLDTTNQPRQRPTLLADMRMLATSQIPNNLTVGTSSDCSEIYLGDFTRMSIAMRERVSIQRLNELYAETGHIGFVGHVRADIAVNYAKAFAVVTGVRA